MCGVFAKYTCVALLLIGDILCSSPFLPASSEADVAASITGSRKRTLSLDIGFESDDSCDDFLMATPRDVDGKRIRSTLAVGGGVPAGPDGGSPGDAGYQLSDADMYLALDLMVENPDISEEELSAVMLGARPGVDIDTIQFARQHARSRTHVDLWLHEFLLAHAEWMPRFYDNIAAPVEAEFARIGQQPTQWVLGTVLDWNMYCIQPLRARTDESAMLPCHPVPSAAASAMQLSVIQQKALFAWMRDEFAPVVAAPAVPKSGLIYPPSRPEQAETRGMVSQRNDWSRSVYMTDSIRKVLIEYMHAHLNATKDELVAEMDRRKSGVAPDKIRTFCTHIRARMSTPEWIHEYLENFVRKTPESLQPGVDEIRTLFRSHNYKGTNLLVARRSMAEWIRYCIRPLLEGAGATPPCHRYTSRTGIPMMKLSEGQAQAFLKDVAEGLALPRGARTPKPTPVVPSS